MILIPISLICKFNTNIELYEVFRTGTETLKSRLSIGEKGVYLRDNYIDER